MLLILFLKVEIEHILVFPKIMLHMRKKVQRQCSFLQKYIKTSLKHLIQNCYFTVSNSLLRQKIDIPMGNDPAPFWANQFLCTWKNEYMSDLMSNDKVKARHFHATKRSIDDLGTLNDGSVFNDVYKDIYPPKLQLKVEHFGIHVTFLNLDIMVKDGVSFINFLISVMIFLFLSFAFLTLIVTSQINILFSFCWCIP